MAFPVQHVDPRPHVKGSAVCAFCGYVWETVAPRGALDLHCPGCAHRRGVFVPYGEPAPDCAP